MYLKVSQLQPAVSLHFSIFFLFSPFNSATVINIRDTPSNWRADNSFVYVGRPSFWGNPYRVHQYGKKAIQLYREKALTSNILSLIYELRGKKLVCHCGPEYCHGNVLADMANNVMNSEQK